MDLSIWPADSDGSVDVFTSIVENAANNLLWDDTPTLIPSMLDSSPSRVHIIVDNAGFELITDLAMADYLIGEIERGANRRVMNGCISSENLTRSYFRTKHTPSPTTAIILSRHPNPFRDSLRSSQHPA
jgi:hypothetical protein